MDIDDILHDATAAAEAHIARAARRDHDADDGFAAGPLGDDAARRADLQALTRAWAAERAAPEVLPWPGALMDRVGERVRRQIELVEEQTGSMDPKVNFHLIIVQTELERVRFLVRSLLRARLAKIDAHPHHHHLMHPHPLSPSELAYLRSHLSLLSTHFATSFLSSFPEPLRKLDERGGAGGSGSGSTDMVQGPDLDQAVFVRVLEDVGTLRVSGTDVRMELRRGDVWVARWSAVREAVLGGRAELI